MSPFLRENKGGEIDCKSQVELTQRWKLGFMLFMFYKYRDMQGKCD